MIFVQGITGATIKLDEFGDSEGNFSVLALKQSNSSVGDRANFVCDFQMTPVGHFQQGANGEFPVSESQAS